jgi:hypothetical protein
MLLPRLFLFDLGFSERCLFLLDRSPAGCLSLSKFRSPIVTKPKQKTSSRTPRLLLEPRSCFGRIADLNQLSIDIQYLDCSARGEAVFCRVQCNHARNFLGTSKGPIDVEAEKLQYGAVMTATLALPHTHARSPLAWRRTHAELFELPAQHVHVHGTKGPKWVSVGITNCHRHIPDTLEIVIGEEAASAVPGSVDRGFLRPNGHAREDGKGEQWCAQEPPGGAYPIAFGGGWIASP